MTEIFFALRQAKGSEQIWYAEVQMGRKQIKWVELLKCYQAFNILDYVNLHFRLQSLPHYVDSTILIRELTKWWRFKNASREQRGGGEAKETRYTPTLDPHDSTSRVERFWENAAIFPV